ncbi:MAG: biotin--[acetyl-CoA-carboxylase] ligase [Firmicutes bacterium]|nr:biotin--[acetyl-CoA-carboxylase] ligase [Bacillota bacterium]
MSTKTELLKYLDDNFGNYVSGEKLAKELGISRAAVNKAARALRRSGYKIYSRTSQGYCIREKSDILSEAALESMITTPCRLKVFDSIGSTNNYAKTLEIGETPVVIVANSQTAGKGRLGRSFASPADTGLYMTLAIKPTFDLAKSPFITIATAVAVCHAIDQVCEINPKIKWVNDLYYRDRKICGILTEAQTNLETGRIDSLIIGIGINCFPGSFPPELEGIAGPISDDPNAFSRTKLAAAVVNNIMNMIPNIGEKTFLHEYRRRCFILGKGILVHPLSGERPIKARAIDIDDNGGLVVEYMEGIRMRDMETLSNGEVTVREID